ncbi:MAG: TolC family protein [Pseudomonadota bacterium]
MSAYISKVLEQSDDARDIADDLYASQLSIDLAGLAFNSKIVPLANVSLGDGIGNQSIGLESRRTNEFGTTLAIGVQSSKLTSDNITINNPYNSKVFVRVTQGLFRRWGRKYNRHTLTLAELDYQIQSIRAQSRGQNLLLEATRRYYAVSLADLLLTKSLSGAQRSAGHLDAASSRHRVGLVSKSDVYRAELANLQAQRAVADRRRVLRREMELFHELLALPQADRYKPSQTIDVMTALVPVDWQDSVLESRFDWQQHLLEVERNKLSVYRAKSDIDPDVNVSLLVEQEGFGDDYDTSSNLDETNWSLNVDVRTTFSQDEEKNALARQRLAYSRRIREGEALKRHVFRDVRDAFDEVDIQNTRYISAVAASRQAELALDLSEYLYNKGASSNLEVLDAESALTDAEVDQFRSLVNYNLAVTKLGLSLGLLTPEWMQSLFVPLHEGESDG